MSTEAGMNRVLREAGENGALRSINHPLVHPWAWLFRETELSQVDTIEVWNDPTYPSNVYGTELGLNVWTCLWNDGWLIPGIGGSDVHSLPTESYEENGPPSLIGDPATCVYAEELSPNAILQATKRGHVYVTRGPVIESEIQVNGQSFQFGDCVTEALQSAQQTSDHSNKAAIQYRVHISGLEQGEVYWIENGERKDVQSIQGDGWYECSFDWSPVEFRWRRMEIRGTEGQLLAFTNPIYCGSKRPNFSIWGPYYDQAYVPESEK